MSTNYYLELQLADGNASRTGANYRIHIGKASRSTPEVYGMSSLSGRHFPDVESWVKFLRHNADLSTVVDEYGVAQDLEEFIANFLEDGAESSATQIKWLRDHEANPRYNLGGDSLKIWDEPQPYDGKPKHWIDSASGKLFYSGEFF